MNTIIKTTSVCDASSVGGGRGWLAGELSKLCSDMAIFRFDALAGDGGRGRSGSC